MCVGYARPYPAPSGTRPPCLEHINKESTPPGPEPGPGLLLGLRATQPGSSRHRIHTACHWGASPAEPCNDCRAGSARARFPTSGKEGAFWLLRLKMQAGRIFVAERNFGKLPRENSLGPNVLKRRRSSPICPPQDERMSEHNEVLLIKQGPQGKCAIVPPT